MSKMLKIMLAMFLLTSGIASAASANSDCQLDQDRMMVTDYNILLVSSFESADHITAYSDLGVRQWDVVFYPKVLSWKLKNGYLLVFSKARHSDVTYLTCMDPVTGSIIWERP